MIDSNGNFRNIGKVTSDITGSYGYTWQPDIAGQYQLIATFAGSESYGSSRAQTYFSAVDVPQATPTSQPVQVDMATQADLMLYVGASTIAIVLAIAVTGMLMIRKRTN